MRRVLLAELIVLGLVPALPVSATAGASTRVLYRSDALTLRADLARHRLRLTYTSRSDFPLTFRCKTSVGGDTYRSLDELNPHEVSAGPKRKTDAASLRGAQATCRVRVRTTDYSGAPLQVAWDDEQVEVLTASFVQPTGDWQTNLYFYNVTAAPLSFECTWTYHIQNDGGTAPGTWTETLPSYGGNSLGAGGAEYISDLTCSVGS